jgi:hypothetical protein
VLSNFRFHNIAPRETSMPYTLSETPAITAISLGPSFVATSLATSAGSRLCICLGSLSSRTFHASFIDLTLSVVMRRSFRCQAVRCGSPPSVNQCALPGVPCVSGICAPDGRCQTTVHAQQTRHQVTRRWFMTLLLRAMFAEWSTRRRRQTATTRRHDDATQSNEMNLQSQRAPITK